MRVKVDLNVPVTFTQRSDHWVASCPSFGLVSQGPTKAKARVNLREALGFFIASVMFIQSRKKKEAA